MIIYGRFSGDYRGRQAALLEFGAAPRLTNNTAGSWLGPWYLLAHAKTLVVTSALEAVQGTEETRPDLVLMDFQLDGSWGCVRRRS